MLAHITIKRVQRALKMVDGPDANYCIAPKISQKYWKR